MSLFTGRVLNSHSLNDLNAEQIEGVFQGVGGEMSELEAGIFDDGVRFTHDVTLIVKAVEGPRQINAVLGNHRGG
jgi:hypothetical protein